MDNSERVKSFLATVSTFLITVRKLSPTKNSIAIPSNGIDWGDEIIFTVSRVREGSPPDKENWQEGPWVVKNRAEGCVLEKTGLPVEDLGYQGGDERTQEFSQWWDSVRCEILDEAINSIILFSEKYGFEIKY